MEGVLVALAILACPVGMGLMMWFMAKGMRRSDGSDTEGDSLEDLRAEHRRIGGEIEQHEAQRADSKVASRVAD